MLQDAGAEGSDGSGGLLLLEIDALEQVDTASPGRYTVYIQTVEQNPFLRIGITLVIQ